MMINPLQVFFWTFRRNEKDVVNLYDALSDVMRLATGGDMLNFGYWENSSEPLQSQIDLCNLLANFASLDNGQKVIDVGSGFSAPAAQWASLYDFLNITCLNINFKQLRQASHLIKSTNNQHDIIQLLNATSTCFPFATESVDRILSLESAQHFKPLSGFLSESKRILKKDGVLAMALPIVNKKNPKLGILSFTWSSEHYTIDFLKSSLHIAGFEISQIEKIGPMMYSPLANYYAENRNLIKNKILSKYPSYLENILFKSLQKMKKISEKNIIDYVLIKCTKKS